MSTLHVSLATSGLVKRTADAAQQPWIARICAALADDTGVVTDHYSCLIRAEDGRRIEAGATRSHGITTAMCERGGVSERFALGMILGFRAAGTKRPIDLVGFASCARSVVFWDAEFATAILNARYAKIGEPHQSWLRPGLQIISLQPIARAFCQLPCAEGDESGGYRSPTRDEAAHVLLGLDPRPLPHSCDANLQRELLLYAELCQRRAFEAEAA